MIAAINGPAAGVGLVLACYCDLRFAAAGAKFTTSNGRLGLPAEYGLSWVLPRLVGIGHAADLLSRRAASCSPRRPQRMGLVNRVLPADELMPATLEYARAMATQISPSSLRETKRQLYADLHGDVGTRGRGSERLLHRMATEPDFPEGVAAWRDNAPRVSRAFDGTGETLLFRPCRQNEVRGARGGRLRCVRRGPGRPARERRRRRSRTGPVTPRRDARPSPLPRARR